ncbi:hypothetical protein QBC44DRAFT_118631 [Cladorrhinum sp. PSN332]|nr:hypothetical protein QBC44DRAFT_118631 [Cladorrhinum sp. PSN332]
MKTLSLFALLLSAIALASGIAQATPSPSRGQALRAAESSPLASPPAPAIGDAVPSSDELSSRDPERLVTEVELQYTPEEEDGSTEKSSPNLIGSSPLRVPTCLRKAGKLHTQRKWSISYDYDSYYNGMHCGLSLKAAMKDFKLCRPMTDWLVHT